MATGDTFRGRRGGGWLPKGYEPGQALSELEEILEAERERKAAEAADAERRGTQGSLFDEISEPDPPAGRKETT